MNIKTEDFIVKKFLSFYNTNIETLTNPPDSAQVIKLYRNHMIDGVDTLFANESPIITGYVVKDEGDDIYAYVKLCKKHIFSFAKLLPKHQKNYIEENVYVKLRSEDIEDFTMSMRNKIKQCA